MVAENEIVEGVEALTIDTIVEGPKVDVSKVHEKKLKKITKAGGKRGIEIEGAADMGGLKFFCTQLPEPEADLNLLIEAVKAMNVKSDPTAEERTGGAGRIGKIVISATETAIAMVAYVPTDLAKECNAMEWLKATVEGTMPSKAAYAKCAKISACEGVSEENWASCTIANDGEAGVFALKLRDAMISIAYNFLKAKGLFPEDDDEDDDDCCWGDEYFPVEGEEEAAATVERYDLLQPVAEKFVGLDPEKKGKAFAKIQKEGGKRGVEIEGAADMGGLQFFCTQMELPKDDVEALVESMRAMNQKSDPTEEERKGGAGRIGKIILSMTDAKICLVAYVPELEDCDKTGEISASEWLLNTVTMILKSGKHDDSVGEVAKGLIESYAGNEKTFAKAVIAKDGQKGLFPLKMKDEAINQSYAYLKARKLFPDGNDDDDDECCWGDDDFPEC